MSAAKDLLRKGLQKSLEDHQVPLHVHLKVVKALSDAMIAHKADMNLHHVLLNRHALNLKEQSDMNVTERQQHQQQLSRIDTEIQRLTTIDHLKGDRGEMGPAGIDGKSPRLKEVVTSLLPYIPKPKDGKDGSDALLDRDAFIKDVVDYIRKEKPLDISHIKNAQSFLKDGIKYRIEELMHGGNTSSNSGSGFQQPLTGVVNGSNQIFTWVSTPHVIVIDQGRPMQKVSSDGTINWTGTTTTILAIAPDYDIFATN